MTRTRQELTPLLGGPQKKDGHLFPDVCTMYLAAIEDGDYKEEKIGCEPTAAFQV